jgi:hypothetical protein
MKEDQPPTTFDQGTILSGMTGSGKFRAVFVTGPSNQNKAKKLAELGTAIVRKEPSSFCALIDSRKTQSPYEWCSQFARTLRTMNGAEPMALAKFAMAVGRSLIPFKPGGAESNPESEANEKVVSKLVKHFEELTEHLPKGANSPKLVIVMDKFESMDNAMLEWLSSTVNQAFRKSPSFTASRFIFSANQKTSEVSDFFSRFGFDKVHEFIFGGLSNPAEAQAMDPVSMAHKTATQIQPSPEIKENKNSLKNAIPSSISQEMDNPRLVTNLKKAKDFFSNYSDDQQHFLILSSYPGKISRYSLEFFSSSRDAALCYNWLKRQTGLCENLANGDLSLRQDVVEFARLIHQERNIEESGKWATLSTVMDTFFKKFPDKNSHWIPVNLHKLNWFNDNLIDRLFADNQCDEIKNFITSNEHAFTTDGNKVSLTEENKVLTQRLLDLSHLEPFAGLLEKAREQWVVDSEKSSSKRTRLENEKKNLVKDVAEAIEEVSSLNNFKEKLAEEFKHPGSLRPERILSFSSSVLLIVIGLGTVGLSLLSESLGSYHAACGLGLTLFGFFWPTIELKRATETAAIASSPLTLDAQQHSLENRISNLNNRLKVMQGNLEVVEGQISKLGDNQEEPYVELED